MKKLELLAPAGNRLKMDTALAYGADAVYLGIPDFSLRVRINDFNLASLKTAVRAARQRGKKVYITINIFAHNQHLRKLPAYLKVLRSLAVDALIVSDPGVLRLVKKACPQTDIHLSTQANCTNSEAVRFWSAQGVKRIILGREVTLSEIREIHRAVPKIELEYFVQGAMCLAYSGRCFLSKLLVGRSGNLGDCAQPCRWEYDLENWRLKTGGHSEELELVEERHGAYLLNSQDLCLIKHLPDLVAAGVTSFKIEGRAKSVYYQAVVVGAYRRALDLISSRRPAPELRKELNRLYKELDEKLIHRGYTSGFLLGGRADQNITNSHNQSAWEFCGQVLKIAPGTRGSQKIFFKVHNTIKIGDQIEIIQVGYDIIKLKLAALWEAKTGQAITEAHGGGGSQTAILELESSVGRVEPLTVLRRRIK